MVESNTLASKPDVKKKEGSGDWQELAILAASVLCGNCGNTGFAKLVSQLQLVYNYANLLVRLFNNFEKICCLFRFNLQYSSIDASVIVLQARILH